MLKLFSRQIKPLGEVQNSTDVLQVTDNSASSRRSQCVLLTDRPDPPEGFHSYFYRSQSCRTANAPNSFSIGDELDYLADGDVIRFDPHRSELWTMYRKNSPNNSFLVTERCNNFCLMCSQPPKTADDGYLVDDILKAIPLIDPATKEIGLTGGEPTLLGDRFVDILKSLQLHLPNTGVHVLSNGRLFKNEKLTKQVAEIQHKDLMIGIPVYSDLSNVHDYVVQADGAFDDTIRGILQLKTFKQRVEIRVVIHKQTYKRLPELAEFLVRNLVFVDHVALMGLEMMGFTKYNLSDLWIDPVEYQPELRRAVEILDRYGMKVSIYNHQLCLLDPSLLKFNVRSISDWKNEYMPECEPCTKQAECGGFFSSATLRYSDHITPFVNTDKQRSPAKASKGSN